MWVDTPRLLTDITHKVDLYGTDKVQHISPHPGFLLWNTKTSITQVRTAETSASNSIMPVV